MNATFWNERWDEHSATISGAIGAASDRIQLQRQLTWFIIFGLINLVGGNVFQYQFPDEWRILCERKKEKLFVQTGIGWIHAAVVSALSFNLAFFSTDPALEADHINGISDQAQMIFAISCAYFFYDFLYLVFVAYKLDVEMVAHHTVVFTCFMIVQQPFLQYYSIRIILFELSTIFLNIRQMLKYVEKTQSSFYAFVETSFGVSFVLVRVVYGVTMSAGAFNEVYQKRNEVTRTRSMCFIGLANFFMTALNLYWLNIIVRTKFKKKKKEVKRKIT